MLDFLPVFYEEVYHIFLQTIEMGIHQPCSDVHSRVPGRQKKENHLVLHGYLQEFDFAIKSVDCEKFAKADLLLSTFCWIERQEKRQENCADCHYWTVSINLHLLALG